MRSRNSEANEDSMVDGCSPQLRIQSGNFDRVLGKGAIAGAACDARQDGSKLFQNGSRMGAEWVQNGSIIGAEWIQDGEEQVVLGWPRYPDAK